MSPSSFPNRKRATIYDLAQRSGVSPGTVSRVLNNRDRVSPETRARVLEAARHLELRPQAAARMRQVAILTEPSFPDRIDGYAARLTAHLSFELARNNASVLHPSDPHTQLPSTFLDGVIAVTFDHPLLELLQQLETRMPVVYMDRFDHEPNHHAVCSDHYMAGYLAGQHLLARGRTRLALFGINMPPNHERLRGFRKAMEEAGVTPDERLLQLFETTTKPSAFAGVVARMVRSGADAIFAPGSSFEGIQCLHVLTYILGLKVPQDIALLAGETPGVSEILQPPLSTIEEPLAAMAETAVERVLRLSSGQRLAPERVLLPVRLVDRASVT